MVQTLIAIILQSSQIFLSNSIQLFTIVETPADQQKQLNESIDQFGLILEQNWDALDGMRSASHAAYYQQLRKQPKPQPLTSASMPDELADMSMDVCPHEAATVVGALQRRPVVGLTAKGEPGQLPL